VITNLVESGLKLATRRTELLYVSQRNEASFSGLPREEVVLFLVVKNQLLLVEFDNADIT
jgi:hypothetical protein